MTFEVYRGLNREPVGKGERFHDGNGPDGHGYYPQKEIAVYSLDDLPSNRKFRNLKG